MMPVISSSKKGSSRDTSPSWDCRSLCRSKAVQVRIVDPNLSLLASNNTKVVSSWQLLIQQSQSEKVPSISLSGICSPSHIFLSPLSVGLGRLVRWCARQWSRCGKERSSVRRRAMEMEASSLDPIGIGEKPRFIQGPRARGEATKTSSQKI